MKNHKKNRSQRLVWFALALLSIGIVVLLQSLKFYSVWLVFLWGLSLFCFILSSGEHFPRLPRPKIELYHLFLFGVLLLPVVVRLMNYTPTRMHGDDLLTASFSLDYHPRTTDFFSGIPDKDIWVSSFPTPYFLFQKTFFHFFGASLFTVKLSILPYVFITTVFLFLIMSLLTNIPTAVGAVWVYAFFAFGVYLETLGLHFVSSTAIFLVFFWLLLLGLRRKSSRLMALVGVFCAFSYLSYTSSYIAFPILLIATVIWGIYRKDRSFLRLFLWACIGFLLGITPFVIYAATYRDYFLERITQISLINGEWSSHKGVTLPNALPIIWDNLLLSLRSLVQSGIGGHGGYTFDRLAFFNQESLILFGIGFCISLLLGFFDPSWWLIVGILGISFMSGMVLTLPPPAYHRLSLTLPFIAMVTSLPIYLFTKSKRGIKPLLVIVLLYFLYFAYTNLLYAKRAISSELFINDAAVIAYVNAKYPHRAVHIAAFPTFALEKEWVFFPGFREQSVDTKFHSDYLTDFHTDERYVYVITLPEEFSKKFIEKDPQGTYIPYSEKYGLFVNEEQPQKQ